MLCNTCHNEKTVFYFEKPRLNGYDHRSLMELQIRSTQVKRCRMDEMQR